MKSNPYRLIMERDDVQNMCLARKVGECEYVIVWSTDKYDNLNDEANPYVISDEHFFSVPVSQALIRRLKVL